MSDILLSVGLQTGKAAISQIQSDLNVMIAKMDSNPPRIKIGLDIDQSSVNAFKNRIAALLNSITTDGGEPITLKINGLGEITAKSTQAASSVKKVTEAAGEAAEAVKNIGGNDATKAVIRISSALQKMKSNLKNWDLAKDGKAKVSYEAYAQQESAMESLLESIKNGSVTLEDYKKRFDEITAAANEAALAIKNFGEDTTVSKHNNQIFRTVSRARKELSDLTDNLKKWTASKHGTTSEQYEKLQGIQTDLGTIIKEYDNKNASPDDLKARLEKVMPLIRRYYSEIKLADEDTLSFGDKVKGLAGKFVSWLGISQTIMKFINIMKKMVKEVIEIDTAMTELKKVTDETDETYDRFLSNTTARAKKLGATISDIVTATADFARLGYSLDDASTLADTAILYKNIGDGIKDINEASESIISTMQAFGIDASNAISIVDKFNEVGKNCAQQYSNVL